MTCRLQAEFFHRNVLTVAPELLGKIIVRRFGSGQVQRFVINEVEAYHGVQDRACHACKGKTPRTEVMFREGGLVYVYIIYGMHWLLNIVTGKKDDPSALLIRGIEGTSGPGRVGKILQLDKTFYGENLVSSTRIWIENSDQKTNYTTAPRIGIGYAGEPWISKPWRYILQKQAD